MSLLELHVPEVLDGFVAEGPVIAGRSCSRCTARPKALLMSGVAAVGGETALQQRVRLAALLRSVGTQLTLMRMARTRQPAGESEPGT